MDKLVTVYVLDAAMGEVNGGRSVTDFEWAKEYVVDELANRMLYGRVSDKAAVVLSHGDETEEVFSIASPSRADIDAVQRRRPADSLPEGAFELAVMHALAMVKTHCKQLKFTKRVVAISNKVPSDSGRLAEIQRLATDFGVTLDLFLIDQPADPLAELPAAQVHEYSEVAATVFAAKPKVIKPVALYKGLLTLGGPERTQLALDVGVYPATKRAAPPATHLVYGLGGQKVTQVRDTLVNGEPVPRDTLEIGYLYGSEIVLFDQRDREELINAGGPERTPGLEIVGFVSEIPAYLPMGESNYVLPASSEAALGVSALARALYERAQVAVARFVRRRGSDIELVSLEPLITAEAEGLLMNVLPFAQDCSALAFNSLENSKQQPTAAMQAAMDAAVDGAPTELDPLAVANPYNHRLMSYIKQRALSLPIDLEVPVPRAEPVGVDLALFDIQAAEAKPAAEAEPLESREGELDLDELLG